jgi:DNA-binding transcriptional MerR regulator/effector-binding domain-containing protein
MTLALDYFSSNFNRCLTLPLLEAVGSREVSGLAVYMMSADHLAVDFVPTMSDPFTIGEFSKITGLSVKTLRFYHEEGLLEPSSVDDQTGYRYYAAEKIEVARVICRLRELEFSLDEITAILGKAGKDRDLLSHLERHKVELAKQARHYRQIVNRLDHIIRQEREGRMVMQNETYDVQEKTIQPMLLAGVRMKGKYSDCGKGFSTIGRRFGRFICGPSFLLHYDHEYKENDADFEACFPVRDGAKSKNADGIALRELPGGRCVALLHKGPYDQLGRSYEKILTYIKGKGYKIRSPSREVYLKGPGMIFRGNPKKYLTEIQMMVE